jgi:small subunit ribosomal protein S18
MARNAKPTSKKGSDRRGKPGGSTGRPHRGRPKVCIFCAEHATWVDYKDVGLLRRFVSDRGRIKSRGSTGTCAQHQRDVAVAVKTARELALLPYSVRTTGTEMRGGRGGGRRGGPGGGRGEEAAAAEDTSAEAPEGEETEDAPADEAGEE